ncbi:uncharacterized protein LOC122278720 [Carya illinoinensis]|uniref:uncharacterized protein LOC122278720 n=1 Tax=Carya illinoinensis TaxID=32201 RepID=UPI001C7297D4|nr:uncharacterized protein LOC122278720 [Carya illinoinensis]
MDKGWMHLTNRFSTTYVEGVNQFISIARDHADKLGRIRCPCVKCKNGYYRIINVVEDHLFIKGIDKNYTQWIFHGEDEIWNESQVNENDGLENVDDIEEMLDDIYMGTFMDTNIGESSTSQDLALPELGNKNFEHLWEDSQRQLYPGCVKFSKLAFIVRLLHLKTINNWSNKSFDMLIDLLRQALPDGETLPKSYYEAKQLRRGLGFKYDKIDACKNDCVLFWKEHASSQECPICKEPRWIDNEKKDKKIPHKVLRHFPLKPRLQRLFMSKKTAEDMRWHREKRVQDLNNLRHPADSVVWKEFDKSHQWFAQESRNVRLGLATYGFNPFGNMSTSHSVWPVILMPYNLPPWKCMKDPYFMMTLLIPGPRAPRNEIDVYLRPLIDELKQLWEEGVDTFDALVSQTFRLHVALLWTINDFPAYANLSG